MTTGTAPLFLTIMVFIFGGHYPGWMGKDAPHAISKLCAAKLRITIDGVSVAGRFPA
jgi:hypothetical protein